MASDFDCPGTMPVDGPNSSSPVEDPNSFVGISAGQCGHESVLPAHPGAVCCNAHAGGGPESVLNTNKLSPSTVVVPLFASCILNG